jgi:hypothetical protein
MIELCSAGSKPEGRSMPKMIKRTKIRKISVPNLLPTSSLRLFLQNNLLKATPGLLLSLLPGLERWSQEPRLL